MDKERKSRYAEEIINNPVWDESFEDMKGDLFDAFCKDIGLDSRMRISLAMDMIDDLKCKIEAKMVEGIKLNIVGDNNG